MQDGLCNKTSLREFRPSAYLRQKKIDASMFCLISKTTRKTEQSEGEDYQSFDKTEGMIHSYKELVILANA